MSGAFGKHHGLTLRLQLGLDPFYKLQHGDVLRFTCRPGTVHAHVRTGVVMGPLRWADHVVVRGRGLTLGAVVRRENLIAIVRRKVVRS